jgi:hypothetical protein
MAIVHNNGIFSNTNWWTNTISTNTIITQDAVYGGGYAKQPTPKHHPNCVDLGDRVICSSKCDIKKNTVNMKHWKVT